LYLHEQLETKGIQQPPNIGRRKPICNCQKIRVIESQKVNANPNLPQLIPSHILINLQLFSIIFEGEEANPFFARDYVRMPPQTAT
jgi:hypothetical protein